MAITPCRIYLQGFFYSCRMISSFTEATFFDFHAGQGENMQFEPFQDRFSRIIRNDLGATIGEVLARQDIESARKVAEKYLRADIDSCYRGYIEERLAKYSAVVELLDTVPADTLWQALVLWDHQLFFEVHEVLEDAWIRARGKEKQILQAMIRAAGVYIKLEYDYTEAAQKIARKAIPVILTNRDLLDAYFDPDTLVAALRECSLPPPQLLRSPPGSAR